MRLFPTYCLRNWEKGKGVGREEEEGTNIVIITRSSVYLYIFISTYPI